MALFAVACRVADGARAVLYWIQFMDKTTLGNSAILGIKYVACHVPRRGAN